MLLQMHLSFTDWTLQATTPECSTLHRSRSCMAHPVLYRLLIQYHSLDNAPFIRQAYQTGIPRLQGATPFHIPIAGHMSHGVFIRDRVGTL